MKEPGHDIQAVSPPAQPDAKIASRRKALGLISALGAAPLAGASDLMANPFGRATRPSGSDASLGALVLSSGSLSPAFSNATTSYTVSVANAVSTITLTATATSSSATITINGTVVKSGVASSAISLGVGTTSISILVTNGLTTRSFSVAVTRAAASSGSNCAVIPQETQGPYPLLAILSNSAIVRKDIRETKTGVPLTLTLTLTNVNQLCVPIANAAVYVWMCDKDGQYSGYSSTQNGNHQGETFLRGIQISDSKGQVTFTTIYPGWYAGRITHIHAQVYLNDNLAVSATATTQFAFPPAVTTAVYNSSLYSARGQNTSVTSFAADNVFSDGTTYQLLTLSGDTSNGYSASLNLGIAV